MQTLQTVYAQSCVRGHHTLWVCSPDSGSLVWQATVQNTERACGLEMSWFSEWHRTKGNDFTTCFGMFTADVLRLLNLKNMCMVWVWHPLCHCPLFTCMYYTHTSKCSTGRRMARTTFETVGMKRRRVDPSTECGLASSGLCMSWRGYHRLTQMKGIFALCQSLRRDMTISWLQTGTQTGTNTITFLVLRYLNLQ